ncbi:hypothetical protein NXX98_27310 [Bacteroides thetaiotaomicron]|uniref:hypothetical protein n=1 Tax=Bacteroides thetaiotaomicron TaxID=818 RepID=UPI00286E8251|nr:hypothetical protein [Bacteroides thetaiotaomicron]MCS3011418.1 hypothetical protein [Bacteroides thetaiotaomicron]
MNIDQNIKFTEEERADGAVKHVLSGLIITACYSVNMVRIPLLPEEGLDYTKEYEDLAYSRNTYDECADFIASEMKQAARDLP